MACRDNSQEELRKEHPQAEQMIATLREKMHDAGAKNLVILSADMTLAEQEMVLLEGYLRDGHSLADAEAKAIETLQNLNLQDHPEDQANA